MHLGAALRRIGHVSGKLEAGPYITMFDDVSVSMMPTGPDYAYAGYTGGNWPTFAELSRRFPGHRLLSIAIRAGDDGDCLDVEKGDATVADAPAWYERQVKRGVHRPCLYTSASNLAALERAMSAAHIERSAYRLWSAHYTGRAHLCGPHSCGYGLTQADGCQFTDRALGLSLDQSVLLPDFFESRPAPVPTPAPAPEPAHSWLEAALKQLPALKQGDKDHAGQVPHVRMMQGLVRAHGHAHKIEAASSIAADGDFGVHTTNGLLALQSFFGLATDRVCGPKTWAALVTGEK